jgi:MYXO-CTERM domain-containing protein
MWCTLLLLAALPTARAEDARVLMLGNSYTSHNDLHTLVAQALEGTVPGWAEVYAQPLTQGGTTLSEHAARADGSNGDTPWRDALVTGPDAGSWDWVVLQDQSQIPGFPTSNSEWQGSEAGAVILDELIQDGGGETVFLLTWGRRDGDSTNPARYPDYLTMQAYLTEGYLAYAEACAADGSQPWIIPAGHAWRVIHQDLEAAGADPTDGDTAFTALYSSDGSHPSPAGSHLAALTAAAALTGRSVADVPTPDSVSEALAPTLRDAADRAALDDPFGEIPYRWAFSWDAWVAAGDDPADGVVISDEVTRPAVLVAQELEPIPSLGLGGDDSGAGRLWITDGGALAVEQLTVCSEDCTLVLSGGKLTVDLASIGVLEHSGGTLEVTGQALLSGDYLQPQVATLALSASQPDDPMVVVDGTVRLDGVLEVQVQDGLLEPGASIPLIRAEAFDLGSTETIVPEGSIVELVEDSDGVLLVLTMCAGCDSDSPDSEVPADSEPDAKGDCGCSSGAGQGSSMAWLLLLGAAVPGRRRP